jgi:PAS domain S-box-containing protein
LGVVEKFLGRLLLAPTFPDERQNVAVRKLWSVLLAALATISLLFPVLNFVLPGHFGRVAVQLVAFDGTFIGLLLVTRTGRPNLASVLLLVFSAAIMLTSAWSSGGLRSPSMFGLLMLVPIAGILLGSGAAVLTTAVAGALSFGLVLADGRGLLPAPNIVHTQTTIWLVLLAAMVILAAVQVVATWVIRQAESRATKNAAEREMVDAARRQTEEKYSTLFRASPDPIFVSDLETGEIMEANPSYERMFGYSRAEVIGRTSVELKIFGHPSERQPMLDAIRANRGVRDFELTVHNRHGTPIPLLFSGELIDLDNRRCMVAVIHDITGRKKAEARAREARDEFTRRLFSSQETERRRIAGELHDSLGQNLILIKNRIQLALELPGATPAVIDQFEGLKELVTYAIAEVRQISHDLRPHQLDQLGLTLALQSLIDGTARSSPLSIERHLDAVDDLFTPEEATHLYRVAQECLANILKHSNAQIARIGLERDLQSVRLWIEDDGHGFPAGPTKSGLPSGGIGLSSIAERVKILGGTLDVTSGPSTGTRVEITFNRLQDSAI